MLDRLILPSPSLALVALLPQVPSLAPRIYPVNRVKAPITCEPVVHFPEWTTGSLDLAGNWGKSPISYELVAHSPEWTTGSIDLAGNAVKSPISYELVAHSPEWTTGSFDLDGKGGRLLCFSHKSGIFSKTKRKRLTNLKLSATLK